MTTLNTDREVADACKAAFMSVLARAGTFARRVQVCGSFVQGITHVMHEQSTSDEFAHYVAAARNALDRGTPSKLTSEEQAQDLGSRLKVAVCAAIEKVLTEDALSLSDRNVAMTAGTVLAVIAGSVAKAGEPFWYAHACKGMAEAFGINIAIFDANEVHNKNPGEQPS